MEQKILFASVEPELVTVSVSLSVNGVQDLLSLGRNRTLELPAANPKDLGGELLNFLLLTEGVVASESILLRLLGDCRCHGVPVNVLGRLLGGISTRRSRTKVSQLKF